MSDLSNLPVFNAGPPRPVDVHRDHMPHPDQLPEVLDYLEQAGRAIADQEPTS